MSKIEIKEKPKLPLNPYFLYKNDKLEELKKKNPKLGHRDCVLLLGDNFNKLSPKSMSQYDDEYAKNKIKYNEDLKKFKDTYPDFKEKKKLKRDKSKKRVHKIIPIDMPN